MKTFKQVTSLRRSKKAHIDHKDHDAVTADVKQKSQKQAPVERFGKKLYPAHKGK